VSPLAGQAVGSGVGVAAEGDAAAAAGTHDHAEDNMEVAGGAVGGLADSEAVGIIGAADRAREGVREVALQRAAVEPERVGILDQACGRDNGARDADADRAGLAGGGFNLGNKPGDGAEGAIVIAARCRDANPREFLALRVERDGFYLGAA
jgi:hypothetical protein